MGVASADGDLQRRQDFIFDLAEGGVGPRALLIGIDGIKVTHQDEIRIVGTFEV